MRCAILLSPLTCVYIRNCTHKKRAGRLLVNILLLFCFLVIASTATNKGIKSFIFNGFFWGWQVQGGLWLVESWLCSTWFACWIVDCLHSSKKQLLSKKTWAPRPDVVKRNHSKEHHKRPRKVTFLKEIRKRTWIDLMLLRAYITTIRQMSQKHKCILCIIVRRLSCKTRPLKTANKIDKKQTQSSLIEKKPCNNFWISVQSTIKEAIFQKSNTQTFEANIHIYQVKLEKNIHLTGWTVSASIIYGKSRDDFSMWQAQTHAKEK